MNFNFELILFWIVVISGAIVLIDRLWLAKKRKALGVTKLPVIMDYAHSFFPVLLLVFLLRGFLYEPFRIPSGSLEPTLAVGDFILVNKFTYGIRIPVIHTNVYPLHEPQRGDIIVFRFPLNPSVDYIKRVVGLPGDHVQYVNKTLFVNDEKMPQEFTKNAVDIDEQGDDVQVIQKQETLAGVSHAIYQVPERGDNDDVNITVPEGQYFVMGDNRDQSADSRFWGFVPEKNIVGKAQWVWFSWDKNHYKIRWDRIGNKIT